MARAARMHHLTAVVTASAACVLAGCGADAPKPAAHATDAPSAVRALPSGVVPATALPSAVPNVAQLRKHVVVSRCEKTPHGWLAAGTAHNPAATPAKYTLTVFFTTSSATVINWATTTVNVKPDAAAQWSVTKDFTAPPQTRCVLRGVGTA